MGFKPDRRPPGRDTSIAALRLSAHKLADPDDPLKSPAAVVEWLGAMQAQNPVAVRWAIGLRLAPAQASAADVERALADGSIVRTHALRGTWHVIAAADVSWLLALVGPQVIAGNARRYRELELDDATFRQSHRVLEHALGDGMHLTRDELARMLSDHGIVTAGQRLPYLLQRAELDGLVCSGAPRGKQMTYALIAHRIPGAVTPMARDEALAELAARYVRGRGPVTAADFAWWSGLGARDARAGLASAAPTLRSESFAGTTYWRHDRAAPSLSPGNAHLLPAFDEYIVGYRDRDAALDPAHRTRVNAGGGMVNPCVVVDGRVIATWQRALGRDAVAIAVEPFAAPSGARAARLEAALVAAARRYGWFLGVEVRVAIAGIPAPDRA